MSDWRDDPATDRQREYAKDLGVSIPPSASKGKASDLITDTLEERDGKAGTIQMSISDILHISPKLLGITCVVLVFIGIILLLVNILVFGIISLLFALLCLYYTIKLKYNAWGFGSTAIGYKSEPERIHALPGTYDESYFVNPKTKKFQFPKYRHDNRFMIKIIDSTDYKDAFDWYDLDAEERKEYSIRDFENDFSYVDLEVEPFENLFYTSSKSHLKPLEELKGQWGLVESLLLGDAEGVTVTTNKQIINKLLSEGYLFQRVVASKVDKLKYYRSFTVTQLREACDKSGVKRGRNKQETIDRMIESEKEFDFPPVLIRSPKFDKWFSGLIQVYINDIRRNADRFHPLYHYEIWDCAADQNDLPAVKDAIAKLADSEYWLKRLTI